MSQETELNIIIRAIDQATSVFRKISKNLEPIKKSADRVGKAFGNVTKEIGMLGLKMTALAAGAGYLFKTMFIDTAAEFEKFQAILETVEGSSLKAKESMAWVSEFASKTPYEFNEVTEAFVKLKSYGLEPTNGLLKAIGNAGAAMGKPIIQGAEAIADAVNGENERLKEFGIRARMQGDLIAYEYTLNGKSMVKTANKNSREMIEATLVGIWNDKFSGAMEKQSRTWNGMLSNISDQWTRFRLMVMNAGVFDYLKDKLSAILNKINEMAESGKLKEVAEIFSKNLIQGFETLYKAGKKLWPEFIKIGKTINDLANFLGGYHNLFFTVAAFMAGPAVMSVISLTQAVWGFTAALFANPVTAWIAGITALAALGVHLYKNWEPFRDLINWTGQRIWEMLAPIRLLIKAGQAIGKIAWNDDKTIPAAKSAGPVPSFDVGSKGITKTGLALVHKGEKVIPAGRGAGVYNVSFSPQFTINGADAGSVARIKEVVKQSFAECMREFQHNQGRLAF